MLHGALTDQWGMLHNRRKAFIGLFRVCHWSSIVIYLFLPAGHIQLDPYFKAKR